MACAPKDLGRARSSATGLELPADWVFRGGAVYTEDPRAPRVEALAVRQGRVAFVGSAADAARLVGPGTHVVELGGQSVIPGLHDAHVHPLSGGLGLGQCQLTNEPPAKVLAEVEACLASHPDDPWLLGRGWGIGTFHDDNPKKELLDAVDARRPIALTSTDGHSIWLNSAGLRRVGIDATTPDPPMGRIERDPVTHEPSGTLHDAAAALARRAAPAPSQADLDAALARALAMANGFGITSMFEANASQLFVDEYAAADRRGALTARIRVAMGIDVGTADSSPALAHFEALRARDTTSLVKPEAIKIMSDGVVGAHTAAMLEPYTDRPDERGTLLDAEKMQRIVARYEGAGFQIHVHAVGDAAVRSTLDALERAQPAGQAGAEQRSIVAHLIFATPGDIQRLAKSGVIADLQPLWARDGKGSRALEPVVGPERLRRRMPVASFVRAGARLAAGSDWPVSSMDPFDAMEAAVTRGSRLDPSLTPRNPDERVDLATILRAYTLGGAYAMREERETGSLEIGKAADFVVLDRDLFAVPEREIHDVKVVSTWLLGRRVYERGGASPRP